MGLSKVPRRGGAGTKRDEAAIKARENSLQSVDEEIGRRGAGAHALLMDSDEMDPTIGRGALVFVNPNATSASSSGLYAIESAGRITIRMVETRLGGGLVIGCDNPRYSERLKVAKASELKRHSVRIVSAFRACSTPPGDSGGGAGRVSDAPRRTRPSAGKRKATHANPPPRSLAPQLATPWSAPPKPAGLAMGGGLDGSLAQLNGARCRFLSRWATRPSVLVSSPARRTADGLS